MSDQHLRMSDAERAQASAALGEHYAQGRLTAEEHGERLDRIWAARTRGELGSIFADLPGSGGSLTPPPPRSAAPFGSTRSGRSSRPRRFRGVPIPLVVLLAVLVSVTVVSHLPIVLGGLLLWALLSRRTRCSSRPLGHSLRHR